MPGEGVLNQRQAERKRGVSGEAPVAWPPEGVLNPSNCVLNPSNCIQAVLLENGNINELTTFFPSDSFVALIRFVRPASTFVAGEPWTSPSVSDISLPMRA
jgi:hypothetical protein